MSVSRMYVMYTYLLVWSDQCSCSCLHYCLNIRAAEIND